MGCGGGGHSIHLAQQELQVTSVDLNKEALVKLHERIKEQSINGIEIINVDIADFVPAKKYDLILAVSVLHFFKKQDASNILAKIKDWLNDGGVVFIRIFSDKDDELVDFTQKGLQVAPSEIFLPKINKFIHYYSQKEIKELMRGFKIIKLEEHKKFANHPPAGEHWHWVFEIVAKK